MSKYDLLLQRGPGVVVVTGAVEVACCLSGCRVVCVAEVPGDCGVEWVAGCSTSKKLTQRLKSELRQEKVAVILASHTSAPHVLAELELLCDLVTRGQYLVVENLDHPAPGPLEAYEVFLERHPEFLERARGFLFKP